MQEAETELFKFGVPVKTRHNEVAPAQFEIAPIFEDSNIATDHNQIIMETLRKVAAKNDFALLLHEKPFAGVNGSGKHNNWSMSDSDGNNLLDPGKTPHDNLQFLTFLLATIKAVYKYSDLLRATIASAGNDHRLGANEAPPAIISIFLGEQLTCVLDNLETNKSTVDNEAAVIDLGLAKLPCISKDQTDRNRTSPFAFTGNKFEFRAVGSSQAIGPANYTLNTIVADILAEVADKLEAAVKSGKALTPAVMEILVPMIKETKPIRFEGNNYDAEWEKEAARRGLPNKKTTPESVADFVVKKNIEVFVRHKILTEEEVRSRHTIVIEQYIKTVNIEAETALTMAKTMILPACLKHQTALSAAVAAVKQPVQTGLADKYARLVSCLVESINSLETVLFEKRDTIHDEVKKADYYCKEVLPAMKKLRDCSDDLEEETDDALWPLPKYREMLFVY
jgi:glutamine synthetase